RAGDLHEARLGAELLDALAAGVAHARAQAAHHLVHDRAHRALVRNAALDAFRHQLLDFARRVLEVAILRALRGAHRAERAHAAIRLVAAALVELDLAGRLFRACEHRADHYAVRARGNRLGEVAGVAHAAVGDQRDAARFQRFGHRHDRADLRHADA